MGKSNRIRNDRASDVLFGGPAPKKKKGMPSWALNAIAIAGAVVLLIGVALLAITSNGVVGRITTVMKTDNFRVTEHMMNYYAKSQYSSFVEENSSYLSAYGLDTSKPLEEQAYSTDADGNVTKTWRDVMMDSTVEQVKEILVYCEAAHAAGFELDDEAKASIDKQLETYEVYATYYQMSADNYVAANYGKGVKLKDIRAAVELATLATKYSEQVGTEINAAISIDDIQAEYDANKLDYDLVDYYSYTFSVKLDEAREAVEATLEDGQEATEEQIIAEYKKMIIKARNNAKKFSEIKGDDKITADEAVRAEIIKLIAEDTFDDSYESAVKNVKEADRLDVKDVKAELIEKVIAAVKDDSEFVVKSVEKTETTEAKEGITSTRKDGDKTIYTILGKDTESEEYYNAFVTFADSFYTSVKKAATNAYVEAATYEEDDQALKWMFGDEATKGSFKTIATGDTKDDLGTETAKLNSFSITAYYLVKDVYQNTEDSKNLGIIVFSSAEIAGTAATKIGEMDGITAEKLEALADELGGTYTDYKDYLKGSLSVDAFDAWVFAEGRQEGDFTSSEEVITLSAASDTAAGSYATVWYYKDGLKGWQVAAKNTIYSSRFTEKDKGFKDTYTVSDANEKLLNKIEL